MKFGGAEYKKVTTGTEKTKDYRVYLEQDGVKISFFHDVPLLTGVENVFNMIVEIPRGTVDKFETNKQEELNPIKQDLFSNGQLRVAEYQGGYPQNYGALPQTYEDPANVDPDTKTHGDDDLLDAIELSSIPVATGDIIQVKALGALGLIDEGQTDWKIIVINVKDPLANQLDDIRDIKNLKGGEDILNNIHHWFRDYKTIIGKPQNTFAFNGEYKGRVFALQLIQESYVAWKKILEGGLTPKGIWRRSRVVNEIENMKDKDHTAIPPDTSDSS
eukprot:TRINITY_DN2319_c0_g1_i1.p1 TRINITY_DN2319_c0_g1~~TRINITY_DN2319_c0_g1_i1.p1  ORF type:complete len:274 (-),score=60.52 TRINITY_DN2319_c0_g1_i1:27-848(-)